VSVSQGRRLFPANAALLLSVAAAVVPAAPASTPSDSRQAFLDRYCVACHGAASKTAGIVLQNSEASNPAARPDLWEKVIRKIKAGDMPPAGMPRPDDASLRAFSTGLTNELDAAARVAPYAGRPVIRRLNRLEYANAIRDLLALEMPVKDELPPDGIAAGFDNIGDALSMSPLLLEQYLKVARKVSEYATGTGDASPVTDSFRAPDAQSAWLGPGMPFGTRGGIRVQHYFPFDGEYSLRAFLERNDLPKSEGVRFFQMRVDVKAGPHVVIATFPDEFAEREGPVPNVAGPGGPPLGGPLDTRGSAIHPTLEVRVDNRRVKTFEIAGMTVGEAAFAGTPGPPAMDRLEISGPYHAKGVDETPSRRRLFVCRPAAPAEEAACAGRILSTIARRAFRREVGPSDVEPFLTQFEVARRKHNFDASIATALASLLLAPDFLFRLEFDPPGAAPGSAQKVSQSELASRLSFFLWNSIPDDELLGAAQSGKLRRKATLDAQVRRMLAVPAAAAMFDNFAGQWLGLRGLAEAKPDPMAYPDFDGALVAAFEEETRLFVGSILRENRSVLDLLAADYTYLNEKLARQYGIPGVIGPGFRRVSLVSIPERGGLLGQGSILLLTSHKTTTSPILRGKWILDSLLNSPPAPPPPTGVPPLEASVGKGEKLTVRQQIERHRKDAACASCHARMDPLGFALENFDVIGRWRTLDQGGEIEPSAKMPNGTSFSGPLGLKQYLLGRPDEFVAATIARLLMYALGRELDARDQPAIRQIMRQSEPGGYRFQDVIAAIVNSVPFQMRQVQAKLKDRS
jgi:mono/diheme cytochrome c family protein